MNALQLRHTLEAILGYYSFTKENDEYLRVALESAPGWYYQDGVKVSPATFMQGRQRVPSNWTISGLETILVESPLPKVTIHVGLTERVQTWTVYIRYHGNEQPVVDYVTKVVRHFGGEAVVTYFRKDDTSLSDRAMINIQTTDFDLQNWPTGTNLQEVASPIEAFNVPPFSEV